MALNSNAFFGLLKDQLKSSNVVQFHSTTENLNLLKHDQRTMNFVIETTGGET